MRFCISIHAPHTGRDSDRSLSLRTGDTNFNPRAPYGARRFTAGAEADGYTFQSTRPIRGATIHDADTLPTGEAFQSTRPIRGATALRNPGKTYLLISIHAPHTGRDMYFLLSKSLSCSISIHAPHTGRDLGPLPRCGRCPYFNPRAPYGARPCRVTPKSTTKGISIHAPHTGRDSVVVWQMPPGLDFNPRAPYGARLFFCGLGWPWANFNPRAPYGARQQKCIIYVLHFCNNRQSKHKNQQETSSVRTFF